MAKILIIDDEPSVLESLEQALRTAGHKVHSAGNGSEAITSFRKDPADLLITDIFMPDRDGLEVIMHFRDEFPNIPIIAITGNPKANTLVLASKLGAVAALSKPFSVDELLTAVSGALRP